MDMPQPSIGFESPPAPPVSEASAADVEEKPDDTGAESTKKEDKESKERKAEQAEAEQREKLTKRAEEIKRTLADLVTRIQEQAKKAPENEANAAKQQEGISKMLGQGAAFNILSVVRAEEAAMAELLKHQAEDLTKELKGIEEQLVAMVSKPEPEPTKPEDIVPELEPKGPEEAAPEVSPTQPGEAAGMTQESPTPDKTAEATPPATPTDQPPAMRI